MTCVRALRVALGCVVMGGVLAVPPSESVAQTARRTAPFVPARLWDGKTPDFRGIWQVRGTAHVNIEGHPGGKQNEAATGAAQIRGGNLWSLVKGPSTQDPHCYQKRAAWRRQDWFDCWALPGSSIGA